MGGDKVQSYRGCTGYPSQPSSSSTPPSSSSKVKDTLVAIPDQFQFQFVRGDIGDIKKTQASHGDRQDCLMMKCVG